MSECSPNPLILIIDDEEMNRKILSWCLAEAGFRIMAARSAAEGFEMAVEHLPDLIILDIVMPGENGFAVCDKLQKHPDTSDIPVIFLSGLSETDDKLRGLESGAVDYVTKPFSGAEVVARTRIHLRLRRARQAIIEEQAAKLSVLRQAQQAMLVAPSDMPSARFAVRFHTVHEAGGDIYDVFDIGEGSHGYFAADVTGHDLGASFWTPAVKTLIRQNAGPVYAPSDTFSTMNSVLRQVLSEGQMLTAAYLALNRSSGKARLVRAGHPEPVLHRVGGEPEFLTPEGDVLGCFARTHHEEMKISVKPGDRFYLYTDGLLERPGRTLVQGQAELLKSCSRHAGLPLDDAAGRVLGDLVSFDDRLRDDVVLLAVEV